MLGRDLSNSNLSIDTVGSYLSIGVCLGGIFLIAIDTVGSYLSIGVCLGGISLIVIYPLIL